MPKQVDVFEQEVYTQLAIHFWRENDDQLSGGIWLIWFPDEIPDETTCFCVCVLFPRAPAKGSS